MNQNVVFTGALRDSFFLRQRFPTMCLVVLMIAALQGCDVNRNVSGEMPANVDEAVAEVVIVQADLKRHIPRCPARLCPTCKLCV